MARHSSKPRKEYSWLVLGYNALGKPTAVTTERNFWDDTKGVFTRPGTVHAISFVGETELSGDESSRAQMVAIGILPVDGDYNSGGVSLQEDKGTLPLVAHGVRHVPNILSFSERSRGKRRFRAGDGVKLFALGQGDQSPANWSGLARVLVSLD